jgi:transitional endoplasmic reticulum ATPase
MTIQYMYCDIMSVKIDLKVFEAYDGDAGRCVARIDYDSMNSIDANIGDIITIEGKRKTAARCLPLYPTDERKSMVRIDGLSRNNAKTELNDFVKLGKTNAARAEQVTIKPVASFPPIDGSYVTHAMENTPLINGDNLLIPYFGGRIDVRVINLIPDVVVMVDSKTIFHIEKNPDWA